MLVVSGGFFSAALVTVSIATAFAVLGNAASPPRVVYVMILQVRFFLRKMILFAILRGTQRVKNFFLFLHHAGKLFREKTT